jgi:exodeoxyribonuclease-1
MSFVFYDIETTGISQHFDQILQFAAIRTDDELNEVDRFEIRSRLQPHVVPSPMALHVTRMTIEEILDPSRPSNFEMMTAIRGWLGDRCPATFVGYNSLRFDEEFLRHAFYQCLHPAYLTNTQGSSRADALAIVRSAATLRPGLLSVPTTEAGKAVFKLDQLAPANGFEHANAHDALADVEATIYLCKMVRDGASDLWDAALKFSHKPVVQDFTRNQEAFAFFEFFGNRSAPHVVTRIGTSAQQQNVVYCLDLLCDHDDLRQLGPAALATRLGKSPKPIRRVKLNGSPLLGTLEDAPAELLMGNTPDELRSRATAVRSDQAFMDRLIQASEPPAEGREPSPHVEQQLYEGGFWSDHDSRLLDRFHASDWETRMVIAGSLEDRRLKRLARRLVFFERPDLLAEDERISMSEELARRRMGQSAVPGPWLTVPKALEDLDSLSERVGSDFVSLREYYSSLTALS